MAASKQQAKGSSFRSTAIAALLVAAAGVITWYGYDPSGPEASAATPATTLTLAGDTPTAAIAQRSTIGLPTRVRIESAGIDAAISEVGVVQDGSGAHWQTAWRSVGHHMDSAMPGNPGNVVLTGHVSVADSRNLAVFANLDDVAVGDIVEVYAGEVVHQYRVEDIEVVSPDDVGVLRNDHRSLVTLITCTPDLEHRLVVVGALVS